ncbi:Gfo/Idh/MocA family oxidoreductase [Flammeovirgaceae bacterium SG7u.111]|nr:Gfo/Idh/MocA family oxidoreductase [Flammeovirgaceae bacterium SG7u.132]WPO33520.1 Gfo/Idh/MocA family oxidoreductase [Flammeovirgaceae bacterium SG7u.111]
MINIAFIGAGGISKPHAFALAALPFYYQDAPKFRKIAVASRNPTAKAEFTQSLGFEETISHEELWQREDIDTVYILGPNVVHFAHLQQVLAMKNIKRVYVEKPLCANAEEEQEIEKIIANPPKGVHFQVGFQFLQMPAIQKALGLWKSEDFGNALHFRFVYKHSDYLDKAYRDKRQNRLVPAPEGGAIADLGSHAFSLLLAFIGNEVEVVNALHSGNYEDVPKHSDLYAEVFLKDKKSKAIGTLVASRVSVGTGDLLEFEISGTKGAIRFNTEKPDFYTYHLKGQTEGWVEVPCGSEYESVTSFPSKHVPGGWLRALIHAHYLFLSGSQSSEFLPGLAHGLEVQNLIRKTAKAFR